MFHYIFHSFLKLRPDRDVRDDDVQRNIGYQDVPGGPAVKNPPANAGDTGPASSRMPQSSWARAPQLQSCGSSLWAATTNAPAPRVHAPQQEKPPQG